MIEIQEMLLDGVPVVRLSGRLDAATSPAAEAPLQALVARGERSFVIDLSGVSYVSSAGIRVMFGAAKLSGARGGQVRLAGLATQVRQVLAIAGVLRLVPADETAVAAVSAIKG